MRKKRTVSDWFMSMDHIQDANFRLGQATASFRLPDWSRGSNLLARTHTGNGWRRQSSIPAALPSLSMLLVVDRISYDFAVAIHSPIGNLRVAFVVPTSVVPRIVKAVAVVIEDKETQMTSSRWGMSYNGALWYLLSPNLIWYLILQSGSTSYVGHTRLPWIVVPTACPPWTNLFSRSYFSLEALLSEVLLEVY